MTTEYVRKGHVSARKRVITSITMIAVGGYALGYQFHAPLRHMCEDVAMKEGYVQRRCKSAIALPYWRASVQNLAISEIAIQQAMEAKRKYGSELRAQADDMMGLPEDADAAESVGEKGRFGRVKLGFDRMVELGATVFQDGSEDFR